jgi:hypothetical protein
VGQGCEWSFTTSASNEEDNVNAPSLPATTVGIHSIENKKFLPGERNPSQDAI